MWYEIKVSRYERELLDKNNIIYTENGWSDNKVNIASKSELNKALSILNRL